MLQPEISNPDSDQDKKIYVNSASYLNEVINRLGALNVPSLKSLYATKLKLIELRNTINIKSDSSKHYRCKRCCIQLLQTDLIGNVKLKPRKLTKFAKNVLSKLRRRQPLTACQRKYHKNLMKKLKNCTKTNQNVNQLIITCKYCKNVQKIAFPNRTKKDTNKSIPIKRKKRKNQNKDKFCGLNKEAVLSSLSRKANLVKQKRKDMRPNVKPTLIKTNFNRGFETESFISLDKNIKSIKIKPKKIAVDLDKPAPSGKIVKKKKKNLDKLSTLLKNSQQMQKQSSNLKNFLQAL